MQAQPRKVGPKGPWAFGYIILKMIECLGPGGCPSEKKDLEAQVFLARPDGLAGDRGGEEARPQGAGRGNPAETS